MNNELEIKRHSYAHILAAAVRELYPNVKLSIGPAIDNGFYYDFDFGKNSIKEEDLKAIEKKMKHLIKQNLQFTDCRLQTAEALKKTGDQSYKKELVEDLKNDNEKEISFYKVGNFEDLCKGPHIESTNKLSPDAFKLDRIAGAYWKGDADNQMLTRIYGLAFDNKKELEEYLEMRKEAQERDHRKLGKELDLFCFSELVGPGLPMFTPKGTVLKDLLQQKVEKICTNYGFEKVMTPHLAKIDLFKLSGHADKFGDELFHVSSKHKQDYVMKPVQCPHQTQIYASRPRSYKDLPIRYMESEKQYRAEKPGEIGGLSRVIAITVEDGHSFCRVDQVKEEVKNMIQIIKDFYTPLGLLDSFWVSLSVRDYEHPEKYIGEASDWDKCEQILQEISDEMKLDAKKCEGEAALYGPKLDFMFKDSLGKEIQIPTVQIDFATAGRFGLKYTNEKGEDETPVMVHRAILGSYERFMVMLIEHFGGAFPVWLSPVQVKLISVGEKHIEFTKKLSQEFKDENIRTDIDISDETVGNKIRKAAGEKAPYVLVVGDKEMEGNKLSIRDRGAKDTREVSKKDFIKEIKNA